MYHHKSSRVDRCCPRLVENHFTGIGNQLVQHNLCIPCQSNCGSSLRKLGVRLVDLNIDVRLLVETVGHTSPRDASAYNGNADFRRFRRLVSRHGGGFLIKATSQSMA